MRTIQKETVFNLESFEDFINHQWISPFVSKYETDATMANAAIKRILNDLENINQEYEKLYNRVIFTTVEGRVKEKNSFFKKLYKNCCDGGKSQGVTQSSLEKFYYGIKDLAGIRFSCPYYDEVELTVNKIIRPKLGQLGYATNLKIKDINYLDNGDDVGYRSYHFFVKVPTIIDIFGTAKLHLCEIQGRSELQHVWAVKSHDLLYKPAKGWEPLDKDVLQDMRQLSNNLRAVDQLLVSIRNRTKKTPDMTEQKVYIGE